MSERSDANAENGARAVLYLDVDDTIVSWQGGSPSGGPGAREFLEWALARFEVRWLTTWAPSGRMDERLLKDLSKMTKLPKERLRGIRGLDWEGGSKLDGIAWLEHLVMGRPFIWIEDDTLPAEALEFLARFGFAPCFIRCDITRDPAALARLRSELEATQL